MDIDVTLNIEKEKEKISKAISDFSNNMKNRMFDKLEEDGFEGWNNPMPLIQEYIKNQLLLKSANAAINNNNKDLIDTANFAMMLWFNNK